MTQLLRPLSISFAVAALTAITVYIAAYFIYPVTGIKVEGAHMLPETYVWNAVSDRASLMTLNSSLLERKIKSNPWVKGAEVSKDWQSGIVMVEVKEHRPVLKGEIDGRGNVYAADGTELPVLGGAGLPTVNLGERRLESILSSGRTLQKNGVTVESVPGVGPGGVEAIVDGRRVIFSGPVQVEQARMLPKVMAQNPDVAVFDLRSPERVVAAAIPPIEQPGG